MIIKPTDLAGSIKAYSDQTSKIKAADARTYKNANMQPDEVILSNQGLDISKTVQKIRESSEVRQEKVEYLKNLVESGNYFVTAYDIASKFLAAQKGELE